MTHCFAKFKIRRFLIDLRGIFCTIRQRWHTLTTIIISIFMAGLISILMRGRTPPSNDTTANSAKPMVVGHKPGTSLFLESALFLFSTFVVLSNFLAAYTFIFLNLSLILIISSLYLLIDFFQLVLQHGLVYRTSRFAYILSLAHYILRYYIGIV